MTLIRADARSSPGILFSCGLSNESAISLDLWKC